MRASLGELLECDSDDLALVSNATAGVNTVLRSLALEPGDGEPTHESVGTTRGSLLNE